MPLIRRYRELGTDLEKLYKTIEIELEKEEQLEIVKETSGKITIILFKNITAVRSIVPKQIKETLREVSITLMGQPDDWLLEIHVGSWFEGLSTNINLEYNEQDTPNVNSKVSEKMVAPIYETELRSRIEALVKKASKYYSEEKIEKIME